MKKYIGLIIAVFGLAILCYNLYLTVKTESNSTFYLIPIGLLLAIGGSMLHMRLAKKNS